MQIECKTCKIVYSENNFFKDRTRKSGYKPRCKQCTQAFKKKWRSEKKDSISYYSWLYKLRKENPLKTEDECIVIGLNRPIEKAIKAQESARIAQLRKEERLRARQLTQFPKERRCFKCLVIKPIKKFKVERKRPNGRGHLCHQCLWAYKSQCKKAANEKFSFRDKLKIRKKFNNQCFKCGSLERVGVDHHRPISKGHALTEANAVALCSACNSLKNNKDPELFYNKEELIVLKERYGIE